MGLALDACCRNWQLSQVEPFHVESRGNRGQRAMQWQQCRDTAVCYYGTHNGLCVISDSIIVICIVSIKCDFL